MMALVIGSRVFTWLTLLDYLGLMKMNTWGTNLVMMVTTFYVIKVCLLVANDGFMN